MPPQTAPIWNSLEVLKLVTAVLTPLSVALFGWWLNRRLKTFEQLQWANQKVIEKRLAIYEEIVPLLNELVCYFTYIGNWKESEPLKIIGLKRTLDKIAYVNAPLLPSDFLKYYNAFIELCFATFSGWGRDAKLRTAFGRRQQAFGNQWKSEWCENFGDDNDCSDPKQVREAYSDLVAFLANELGVGVRSEPIETGRVPFNIH